MGAFKVLMWKHCVVRKRRYIQTFVELVTPVALVLGVFLLKEPMLRKSGGTQKLRRAFSDSTFSLDSTLPPFGVLYTPDSEAAHMLMNEVTQALGGTNESGEYVYHTRSLAFPDVALAVEAMFLISHKLPDLSFAMVEFEDMEGAKLPNILKYTIRMTSLLSSMPKVRFQRLFEKFENVPQSFLPLQWAIDSSYLKLRSNSGRIMHKVTFEPLSDIPLKPTLNKTYVSTVFFLLTYISFGAPLLPFVFLMNRLLEERATGIQELVKMVGVTPTILGVTQFLNALPACLIYCIGGIILMKSTDTPMVPGTNAAILFTEQFLHFVTMIALAYACSHISSDAQHTVSMSLFAYIGTWIPIRLLGHESKSDMSLFFHGLLPHCPAYWFLNEAMVAEVRYETGIQFDKWNSRYSEYPDGSRNASAMAAVLMQLLQIFYLFVISWFLEKVRPGKYGIALPWNFMLKVEYWCPDDKSLNLTAENVNAPYDAAFKKYFEQPPSTMKAGIKIRHVSKIFGSGQKQFQALNNVTLDIYEGEITVLLGHNGAGKTTLISIITGMINPTSGKVYVNGMDTTTQQAEVRKNISFCPQHNLFFPDMTVLEHLKFFSLIKGETFDQARMSAFNLMDQLDLIAYADSKTTELSGGLLRRLQLGCALCGNANVLVLDEPTSGLDVEARRELWDTLLVVFTPLIFIMQSLRGNRTLVLTTHFMEEADVLGDRMAALHGGKLRCHATPMFLKKAVGSGFRINITTKDNPNESQITQSLKDIEPEIMLKERSFNTLTYVLPTETNLSVVFRRIEDKNEELNIKSLGVGVTTLEEVFLQLCCDVDTNTKDANEAMRQSSQLKHIKGIRLVCRQMKTLFKRQIDYTMSKKTAFLLLHVVMPFVLCTSLTQIFNILDSELNQDLPLNLDMYSDTGLTKAVYNIRNNATRSAMSKIKYAYPLYEFNNLKDIAYVHSLSLAQRAGVRELGLEEYVVGIALNDTTARILYTPGLKHSAPVGLNLLSNIMSVEKLPEAHGKTIITKVTNNYPVLSKPYHIPKTKINCSLFAIFNICTLIATTLNDLSLPCHERLTVTRHTHIMAGCSPALYWLVTFLYHITCYLVVCCTATLVAASFFDHDRTIDDRATLVAIFVVVSLSGMNSYAFMYFLSFCFNERTASLLLVAFLIVFGFLTPILIMGLEDLKTDPEETLFSKIMNFIGLVIPVYAFTKAFIAVTDTARFNSFCSNNFKKCPDLLYYSEGFNATFCCSEGTAEQGPFNHFAFSNYGAGLWIVVIAIQFACFSALVLLLEYGVFNRWWNAMSSICKSAYPRRRYCCHAVDQEEAYVAENIRKELWYKTDTMLVEKAWKVYRGLFGKKTFAVRGASFSVKKGECFGILGLNGAGKTSTFKLITTEESLTKGRISVDGHFSGSRKYLGSLGYCPQFSGLDEFRSGAANLRTLLIFRGLTDDDARRETAAWLEVVGLSAHAGRTVSGYSGGMARRLAAAAALCGGAALTLLDEPSAGVDTAARRLLWAALRTCLAGGRAIAMSSHCMDEMERLCHRVMILSTGEVSALGAPRALRERYAAGHAVVFKLRASLVDSSFGKYRTQLLKRLLEQKFNCTMKDKHLTSLHYRINERVLYSEIFARIEELVAEFQDLVEDYSVSDTTLEDVFLSFAADPALTGATASNIPVTSSDQHQ